MTERWTGLFFKGRIVTTAVSCFLLVLSVYSYLGYLPPSVASGTLATTSGSWNPSVTCSPMVVTIEQVLGNQTNSMGGATESGSMFNPGITSPVGSAKRWLTPGPTPPGWVSPGPPCTMTNANGQVVSAFVEIHRIQRNYLYNEDYAVQYDSVNGGGSYLTGMNLSDTTFNAFTPSYATCTSANTTGCMHTIHVEFDHDWKAAGYCGPNTACDPHAMAQATPAEPSPNCQKTPTPSACYIDVQGFIFFDTFHDNDASHSFSGWEIHPLTAWRISSASPDFSLSANPSSMPILPGQSASSTITVNSLNSFTGSVSFAITVVAQPNSSGPTPMATISPSSVTVSASGTAVSTLTVTTASSDTGNYTVTVTGTSANLTHSKSLTVNVVDFSVVANPTSLSIPIGSSGQSTLTLASINGFSGSVGLSANVSPTSLTSGLSPSYPTATISASNVALAAGGTGTVMLTVSASLLTTPGTYAVTISATNSGVTHTTVVNITVTLV